MMPSRRSVLAGAGGLLFAGLAAPAPALARHHRVILGAFEVIVVSDGGLSLPIGFVLPETPRGETDALFAAAGLDPARLQSQVNVMLVRTPTDLILIDAGGGTDFMAGLGQFPDALKAAGIEADKVTKVIFTHAHADHLWGAIDDFDTTRYPGAPHLMSAAELDYWRQPGLASRLPDAFQAMAAGTARRLRMIDDLLKPARPGDEIAPGVSLVDTSGHTPGHVSVLLTSGSEQLLIGGDVLTQSLVSFARPDWRWGADMDAAKAAASRRRTLDMLADDRIALLGTHLPWPGLGRVERKDGAFRFVGA
jgi:glyoxylase-like metal-dependent hydrolase (beta-lactamase superfamily II)